MKKIILATSMAFFAIGSTNAQMSISPEVGVNLANIAGDNSDNNKMLLGIKGGVNFNFPISDNLYIAPGIFYNGKGTKVNNEQTILTTTVKTEGKSSLGYIEVPINVLYRYPIGDGALMINAGPYVAYGIAGKNKFDVTTTIGSNDPVTVTNDNKVDFGSDAAQTNAFDYGINAGVGYELPMGLFIRAQYGYGLGNLSNVDGVKNSNTAIQLSLGYNIWSWSR